MRKIKVYLSIGYAGCNYEDEFEVDDDLSEEEIEEMARESVFDRVDWNWEEVAE